MYVIVLNDFIYTGTSLNGIRPPSNMWIQFIGITVWEEILVFVLFLSKWRTTNNISMMNKQRADW